ncbi:MAG TPA: redox-sensing transcriptional repressor Rex [Candidatus Fermentibacter daniensis]|jgi:redox-sensing transcriptional repressor|nr:MAG: hypothetical protein AO395_04780 [Candidatus Fermentibacter daniensis]MBP7720833.1 redox-sensing transcriptional repressor Rex [Candidatus Fermentibacter sp.]OQC70152.1 MAG: Redox-sensing transcriptional repressor Rex [candidate division Hyd24-12 bacterium ADurb.Bin004]KZD16989.1 MAG: hypothetical protein AO394_06445 [Candidatus Fermentibacter daniensis]MCC6872506.1 redox-sensing transcriptional repressor Rex [Candidatus Fermentibacter sp.]
MNGVTIASRTIGRLSLYRRLLESSIPGGRDTVFSHELAGLACVTPAQVRRDLMATGCSGSPGKGYRIRDLIEGISKVLDDPEGQSVALVGVGNLGRAILTYFSGRRRNLRITASFDVDPLKTGRVINGCRCYSMSELGDVLERGRIKTAILAVPAGKAQETTDALVAAGVRGILNYAPVPLRVPDGVFLEERDMTMSLETVAFFARKTALERK